MLDSHPQRGAVHGTHCVSTAWGWMPHPCKCVHRTLGIESSHRFTTESFVLICNSLLLRLKLAWRPELSARKLTGSTWTSYFATFIKGVDIKPYLPKPDVETAKKRRYVSKRKSQIRQLKEFVPSSPLFSELAEWNLWVCTGKVPTSYWWPCKPPSFHKWPHIHTWWHVTPLTVFVQEGIGRNGTQIVLLWLPSWKQQLRESEKNHESKDYNRLKSVNAAIEIERFKSGSRLPRTERRYPYDNLQTAKLHGGCVLGSKTQLVTTQHCWPHFFLE